MEFVAQKTTTAGPVFYRAKRDFDAGDFASAVIRAREADMLVSSQVRVTNDSAVSAPTYSIIVVTYRDIPDVYEAFSRLTKYSRVAEYEIIVVNNGNPTAYSIAKNFFRQFRWIEVGFNYCCSGARNLGARAARGDYVIFVDDDGFIAEGAIENLIEIIEKYQAVIVRGRVLPKSTSGIAGSRYDLGDDIVISGPNAECLLICRRDQYLKHGGFDTLLAGHEGWALCSKIYPFYGPEAFLYAPHAVIFHDFANDAGHAAKKMEAYDYNNRYLAQYYPSALDLRRMFGKKRNDRRALNWLDSFREDRCYELKKQSNPVSVLATAKTGANSLSEFTEGLKSQTHSNFELIFMPTASDDETAERMVALWQNDGRLRLFRGSTSRSAALNSALALAQHNICVMADADYISHPRRLEFTVRQMLANPEQACISFATFNEQDALITPVGNTSPRVGIRTRGLLGMPVSFQTFGFRKAQFKIPFRPSVGEDRCWIHENFQKGHRDGTVVPLNLVFDRGHFGEKAYSGDPLQLSVALSCLYSLHQELLGPLSGEDKLCVQMLSGLGAVRGTFISEIHNYVSRLTQSNLYCDLYDQDQLEHLLFGRLSDLKSRERKRSKRV
jgi:glycosyltransferase involved in cell wall biosynthesis